MDERKEVAWILGDSGTGKIVKYAGFAKTAKHAAAVGRLGMTGSSWFVAVL